MTPKMFMLSECIIEVRKVQDRCEGGIIAYKCLNPHNIHLQREINKLKGKALLYKTAGVILSDCLEDELRND